MEELSSNIPTFPITFLVFVQRYQTSLRFSVFPAGCRFYRGPHDMDCLTTLWEEAGCLLEGFLAPSNLTQEMLTLFAIRSLP